MPSILDHFGITRPPREPEPAPPTPAEHAAVLLELTDLAERQQRLRDDAAAADAALRQAEAEHQRACEDIHARRRQLASDDQRRRQAEGALRRLTAPSTEEIELEEEGSRLQREAAKLRHLRGFHSTSRPDVAAVERELKTKERKLEPIERAVAANPQASAGPRLRDMQQEVARLRDKLERTRAAAETFNEIQELKQAAEAAFARRDELRAAREQQSIDAAVAEAQAATSKRRR